MTKLTIDTKTPHPCNCGETHKGHICWFSRMHLLAEIRHLTSDPTVQCTQCGAKANQAHNVCFPGALEK